MELRGKTAVVTGGGTGVGRAACLKLANLGCAVAVNYSRSQSDAEAVVNQVNAAGVAAVAIQADVASDADCRRLMQKAHDDLGGIDVLINSAGVTRFIDANDLDSVTEDAWTEIFAVNVRGAFQCIRAAAPFMAKRGGGEIVNISSIASLIATGSSIPYCASKAALNSVTLSLARSLAPSIRVNAVAPGFITGRWLENGLGERYPQIRDAMANVTPLQRVCDPEDVAECVLSLITGSDMVTGQILAVDGGVMLARPTL